MPIPIPIIPGIMGRPIAKVDEEEEEEVVVVVEEDDCCIIIFKNETSYKL